MADGKRIGIDLDNTLINYDSVFRAFATERGLVDAKSAGSKAAVREALRAMPDGEIAWQRLQGVVYGKGVSQAVLFDGADAFLRRAREQGCEIFVVSHKTEFGHYDPDRVNLRHAARAWMETPGLSRRRLCHSNENVLFASTRSRRRSPQSANSGSAHGDSLPEVLEDRGFPAAVTGILFTGGASVPSAYPRALAHWQCAVHGEMVSGDIDCRRAG